MKTQKIILGCLLTTSIAVFSQVGINTSNPSAALDLVSMGNTSATKALEINNSSATEMFTVQNDGNIGVNSPAVVNNTAQFNINSGSPSKSVLKLNNISNTKDKSSADINYNQFSSLVADNNGNVFIQYDIKNSSGNPATFDGVYNAGTAYTNLIGISNASITQFQLISDFVFGNTATGGSVLYADITYSRDNGFQVTTYGASSINTNTLTITGIGSNTLTFNYGTGIDLIFNSNLAASGTTSGNIQYRVTSGSNIPFNVFNSFRSRL